MSRLYPYSHRAPGFNPSEMERGIYMLPPEEVEPFMHVERDPQSGGRNAGGVKGSALDSWAPGHGLDVGPDEYPDQNQWMEALTNSVSTHGWQHPGKLLRDESAPHGYVVGEGNHRVAVARRLGVPVPMAVGYESDFAAADVDWRDRRNVRDLLSEEQFT